MENASLFIVVIAIVLIGYAAVSYPLLKWLGVKENLAKRAFSFATSIFLIQSIPSGIASFIGVAFVGSLFGLVGSYYYVQSVLKVSPYKNIAIIFFLPIIAMIPAAILLLLWFDIFLK